MSHTITIEQATAQLPELIRSLRPGDEIVVTEADHPVARILPSSPAAKRQAGTCRNLLTIVSEDDEHLQDFKDYMP